MLIGLNASKVVYVFVYKYLVASRLFGFALRHMKMMTKKRDGSWPRFSRESSNNQSGKLIGPSPPARLIVSSQYPLKDPNPALYPTETILNSTYFMTKTILRPKHNELKNLTNI